MQGVMAPPVLPLPLPSPPPRPHQEDGDGGAPPRGGAPPLSFGKSEENSGGSNSVVIFRLQGVGCSTSVVISTRAPAGEQPACFRVSGLGLRV